MALLVIVAALFSFLNAGERVTLDLGFAVLYRISLVGLIFSAFLLGMIIMFLFGLRYDRRVRDALREQSARTPPPRDAYRSHQDHTSTPTQPPE